MKFAELFSFGRKDVITEASRYSLLEKTAAVISDITEASVSTADVELAIDDAGWIKFAGANGGDYGYTNRRTMLAKSRLYWHRDPLVKQAVRIWTDYSINTGMTFQVMDDADAVSNSKDRVSRIGKLAQQKEATPPDPPVQAENADDENPDTQATQQELEKFWNDRRNRKVTSREGQRTLSKRLLVDGEVFLACWDLADGKVVRRMDPLEITDLIKDPDDADVVIAYRRVYEVGNKPQTKYYRNLMITDEEFDASIGKVKGPNNEPVKVEDGVLLYHIPFDSLKDRGNPLAASSIDWAREHRRFMEARVAIVQALSKFAHKLTAKGGQKTLDAIRRTLESGFTGGVGTGIDKNPSPAPGGTWMQNDAVSMEQMPRSTGGGDSKNDGDQLKLMHCAGTGIMLHYFGDPSTGNLATATTMELPMLKQFEAYQAQWADAWRDIFAWVLEEDPTDDENRSAIDIDYPYMVQKDLNILSQAINNFTTAFPELKVDAVLTLILTSLGINNTDEVLDMIELKRQEVQQKQQQQSQQAHEQALALAKTAPAPVAPVKPLAESIDQLIAALESGE